MKKENTEAKKVLIVEDEGDMCLLINIILADDHIHLEHVKTLAEATAYLTQEQPGVILLDNKLPDGFGVDYLHIIKKIAPDSKIVMVTGFDHAVGDVAVENGADHFLPKPFTRDQLTSAVRQFI